MGRLFGTDGVRGVANIELTADLAFKIGQAAAFILASKTAHAPHMVVGRDTRISGYMLESALTAGMCSVGATAVLMGVLPTPAVAHLTKTYAADAGIMISASHNSFEFNGIKLFDADGYKLPDNVEDEIEALINDNGNRLPKPSGAGIGNGLAKEGASADYVSFLKGLADFSLAGKKIALDCANGAAYIAAPRLFRELGAEVAVINDNPDGININNNCGSTRIDTLREFMKDSGIRFDVGFAFDGDADRVFCIDDTGRIIDGDILMAISARHMKYKGVLARNTIVSTVMSNIGLDLSVQREGISVVRTKVGDRYILEEIRAGGYNFGGEQSGHIIYFDSCTTGDGILTALKTAEIIQSTGAPLSDIAGCIEVFPQVLRNARVSNHKKDVYMDDEVIACKCREVEYEFEGEGRILIRPSGTEPLIRVMIEGRDQQRIVSRAEELVSLMEKRLG